jgi:hypothetical protein
MDFTLLGIEEIEFHLFSQIRIKEGKKFTVFMD